MARQAHRLTGEWRSPINTSADEKGGIHDDETAEKLGFDGGTIAGSIHMEQFAPMLVEHFGEAWWRTGGISLFFKSATMHKQPVRCLLEPERDGRAAIWMENESGDVVMSGTASMGDDPESEVKHRVADARPATDIRMFADVVPGAVSERVASRTSAKEVDQRLSVITESLPCYEDPRAFGARVVPMAAAIHLMRVAEPHIAPIKGPFVGMFGAIEIQHVNGPILAERDYEVRGEALKLSESPKTEIIWHRHTLLERGSDVEVARMIKMDRLLKGASPLWAD